MIRIQHVYLRYGDTVLLQDFNFALATGQFTSLLGPSGVGKTTVLKLLANLSTVGKKDELHAQITDDSGEAQTLPVVYMAQQDGLLPWLSVLDNVLLGDRLRKKPLNRPKAEQLLQHVGLLDACHKKPSQLSGGMRQRVALVRTLMEDRDIILMDEPFSALDAITRLRLQNFAAQLLSGKTVLMITHDPLEALRISDCVYIMQGQPASLSSAIHPKGHAPRDVNDAELLSLQAQLLNDLSEGIRV